MTDTFRWRPAIGAVLIAGGYGTWLVIPLVLASGMSPSAKSALTAFVKRLGEARITSDRLDLLLLLLLPALLKAMANLTIGPQRKPSRSCPTLGSARSPTWK